MAKRFRSLVHAFVVMASSALALLFGSSISSAHAAPFPDLEFTYSQVIADDPSSGGSVTVDMPALGWVGDHFTGSITATTFAFALTPPIGNLPGGGTYVPVSDTDHTDVRFEFFIDILDPYHTFAVSIRTVAGALAESFGTANSSASSSLDAAILINCSGPGAGSCVSYGGFRHITKSASSDTTVLGCSDEDGASSDPTLLFTASSLGGLNAYFDIYGVFRTSASADSYTCIPTPLGPICSFGRSYGVSSITFDIWVVPEPSSGSIVGLVALFLSQ